MSPQKKVRVAVNGLGQSRGGLDQRTDATDATFFHAGLAKLPGLLGVAVQSGVRWRRAAESAFRTPSASRSVVYTGVPGCCRQESSNPPLEVIERSDLYQFPQWRSAFTNERKDHRYYELVQDTLHPEFDYRYFVIKDAGERVCAVQPFFWLIRICSWE